MVKVEKFSSRMSEHINLLKRLYISIYGDVSENDFNDLLSLMKKRHSSRKKTLKDLDSEGNGWYRDNEVVAMMLYTDLFSEDLNGLKEKVDYFKELDINLLHLMPLLEPRVGECDGGYAVKNYKAINPALGTMKEFEDLVGVFRENGIRLCIDYVVNHTSDDHEWAIKAKQGDPEYQDLYMFYEDRTIPDKFEDTVPEVFPKVAPGNFTYIEELDKYVFTSFYSFQWDLNYRNPKLLNLMLDNMLYLANKGVEMLRMDAIPFVWKEVGTSCRNHPLVHDIVKIFNLVARIVCPSLVLLGEAIVEPREIIKYFGNSEKECHLMYNASNMVEIYNSLATRDARHLSYNTDYEDETDYSWINYLRCHDDIGWGLNEKNLLGMDFDPYHHKQYLIEFYKGDFPGSFSMGELYEFDEKTMDARNSGTLASLLGLEKAMMNKDNYQRELAIKRIIMVNNLIMTTRGIPMLYSGDELGFINHYDYLKDGEKSHDSRWMHRQKFDWSRAERRKCKGTNEQMIFENLKTAIQIRKSHRAFHSDSRMISIKTNEKSIYGFLRSDGVNKILLLFNFSEDRKWADTQDFRKHGFTDKHVDLIQGKTIDMGDAQILLGPYESLILK